MEAEAGRRAPQPPQPPIAQSFRAVADQRVSHGFEIGDEGCGVAIGVFALGRLKARGEPAADRVQRAAIGFERIAAFVIIARRSEGAERFGRLDDARRQRQRGAEAIDLTDIEFNRRGD